MSTDPQFQCKNTTSERLMAVGASDSGVIHFLNYLDSNNSIAIYLDTESCNIDSILRMTKKTNGTSTTYNLYGTHNITKVTKSLKSGSSALSTNAIYLQYE